MSLFGGLIAAAHTPFDGYGDLRLEVIDRLARRYARAKLNGVFVCGTTGEFFSLSIEERQRIAERWSRATAPGGIADSLALIVHVGGVGVRDAEKLAAHASEIGADAIASIAPALPRPECLDEIIEYCARVAGGARDLPFFLYHIPALTNVRLSVDEFFARGAALIPSLQGVKFSDLDLVDFAAAAARDGGRYRMLFGVDESLLAALALGANGAVGTTYGFMPALGAGIIEAFEKGDIAAARALQVESVRAVRILLRHGGHAAMKSMLRYTGIDCGPVRAPSRSPSGPAYRTLIRELEEAGVTRFFTKDDGG